MRRKLLPLLSVLALLLVAAGGAAAAGDAGTNITTPPEQTADSGTDAGICLVGADSPCNDAASNDADVTHPTPTNNSTEIGSEGGQSDGEDGQLWIPEDQNRDGEIDNRFDGDAVAGLFADFSLPFVGVS
jgi:hypothetical protein